MKKFIIAICGVMLAGGAIGAEERTYEHPNVIAAGMQEAWGWSSNFNYKTDVSKKISPESFYGVATGTYGGTGSDGEGSIIPVIAHEIYEHGGLFSMTQMQAAWTNKGGIGKPRWIDFFNHADYKQQVVCESGWSGTKCEKQKYDCSDSDIDYTKKLNNPLDGKYRILSGEQDGRITSEIDVFDYLDGYMGAASNLPDGNFSNSTTNDHYSVVLAAISIKPKAIIVGPTKVKADKDTITKALSNKDSYRVLCAPGYTENATHDDCVKALECETNSSPETPSSLEQECPRTLKQGINSSGGCEQCGDDEMFDGTRCKPYKKLSALQLKKGFQGIFDCWQELGGNDYKTCVLCTNTYDKSTKTCPQ